MAAAASRRERAGRLSRNLRGLPTSLCAIATRNLRTNKPSLLSVRNRELHLSGPVAPRVRMRRVTHVGGLLAAPHPSFSQTSRPELYIKLRVTVSWSCAVELRRTPVVFKPPYGHLAERERALRPRTNEVEPMCHFCRGPGIRMGPGPLDAPDDEGKYRDAILLHSFRFGFSKPCHCRLPLTRLASTIRTSSFLVPFPRGPMPPIGWLSLRVSLFPSVKDSRCRPSCHPAGRHQPESAAADRGGVVGCTEDRSSSDRFG